MKAIIAVVAFPFKALAWSFRAVVALYDFAYQHRIAVMVGLCLFVDFMVPFGTYAKPYLDLTLFGVVGLIIGTVVSFCAGLWQGRSEPRMFKLPPLE